MMTRKETHKKFLARVIKDAGKLSWLCYFTWRSKHSPKGFPDLVLAHRIFGVVFAELKIPPDKPTPEQALWIEVLRAARMRAYVWTPADQNEIDMVLTGRLR